MAPTVNRLLPDPGRTDLREEFGRYRPFDHPHEDRPFVAMNMVATVDGRATVGGGSTEVGSRTDTELLLALRTRFDAIMIGAQTMRTERYGRLIRDPQIRARRERIGLPHDPLAVIVSGRMDLPFDAPLFTEGNGRVLIFTTSDLPRPETATKLRVVRMDPGADGGIELAEVLRHLRIERGVRALLCEGGPRTHAQLETIGAVDHLFLTTSPKLAGAGSIGILEGELPEIRPLRLERLLERESELYARYGRAGTGTAPPG